MVQNSLSASDLPARERIEKCALTLFATRGFAATSVREIVEAAGVTKPVLYYYYRNKEHLYESLILNTFDSYHTELVRRLEAPGSLADRLARVACLHFELLRTDPLLVPLLLRAPIGFPPHLPRVEIAEHLDRNRALLLSVLQDGARQGEIPPHAATDFSVTMFMGMVHIYILRTASGFKDDLTPALAAKIARFFLDGARNPSDWLKESTAQDGALLRPARPASRRHS